MKNQCIHLLDKKTCLLCKELQEEHMAYQCLYVTSKDTTEVPDIQDKNEVLRWYRRSI